jgi:DNA-binding NarL/FixJ family response regulator
MMKVAILEDNLEIADRLLQIFKGTDDIDCRQVYHSAEDAMNFLPVNPVDILIVDIGLPRKSGIDAIKHLTEYCPMTQFCVFTVYEDDDKIFQSISAGAKAYILKASSGESIIQAVRELFLGGSPMSPTIARRVLDIISQKSEREMIALPELTNRENELLRHLAQGLYYKEIAEILGITTGTVKQHIHRIYDKLQVSNRTEAINKMIKK